MKFTILTTTGSKPAAINTKDMIMSEVEAQFHVWRLNESGDYRVALYIPKPEGSFDVKYDGPDVPEGSSIVWARVTTRREIENFIEEMDGSVPNWDNSKPETRVYKALFSMLAVEVAILNQAHEENRLQPFPAFFRDNKFWGRVWERRPEKIRKPVHLERQQQRDSKRGKKIEEREKRLAAYSGRQLPLELVETLTSGHKIDSSGIVLSPVASNVSHAFQAILDETGYSEEDSLPNGHNRLVLHDDGFSPEKVNRFVIYASRTELARRAGYLLGSNGRYATRDKKAIEEALKELDTSKHTIGYTRGSGSNQFKVNVKTSLAHIDEITIEKVPKELAALYDKREVFYRIELHPIYADGFGTPMIYQSLKDLPLLIAHSEKKLFGQARRRTNYTMRFVEYLSSNSKQWPVSEALLAERIGATKTLKQRHKQRDFERIIEDCVAVAKDIGILESWELIDGKYHYKLKEM